MTSLRQTVDFALKKQPDIPAWPSAIFRDRGHGESQDGKRGWGVQKWRQSAEILPYAPWLTILGLVFDLVYVEGLAS